jgi:hypothetical protein
MKKITHHDLANAVRFLSIDAVQKAFCTASIDKKRTAFAKS